MGFFSRKKSDKNKRTSGRVTTSGEAEVAELRVRARRRLLGALVLVVAAIIIVPQVFDEHNSHPDQTPIVLPANIPNRHEPDLDFTPPEPELPQEANPSYGSIEEATTALQATEPSDGSTTSTTHSEANNSNEQETVASKPAQSAPTETKPEVTPKPAQQGSAITRTDDGSEALAMLEGRSMPESVQTVTGKNTEGNFILQIAAYSTEADAIARRNKLVEAGVGNAYVEKTTNNNNTAYRLRVGSFTSRDAAQAAQARLRALGYDNSLILTQ